MEYQHAAGCSDALGCSGCRLHMEGMERRWGLWISRIEEIKQRRKSEIYGKFEWFAHMHCLSWWCNDPCLHCLTWFFWKEDSMAISGTLCYCHSGQVRGMSWCVVGVEGWRQVLMWHSDKVGLVMLVMLVLSLVHDSSQTCTFPSGSWPMLGGVAKEEAAKVIVGEDSMTRCLRLHARRIGLTFPKWVGWVHEAVAWSCTHHTLPSLRDQLRRSSCKISVPPCSSWRSMKSLLFGMSFLPACWHERFFFGKLHWAKEWFKANYRDCVEGLLSMVLYLSLIMDERRASWQHHELQICSIDTKPPG